MAFMARKARPHLPAQRCEQGASTALVYPSSSGVSSASCRGGCDGGASRGLGRGPSSSPGIPLSTLWRKKAEKQTVVLRWREETPGRGETSGDQRAGPGDPLRPAQRAHHPVSPSESRPPPPPRRGHPARGPLGPTGTSVDPALGAQQRCGGGDVQVCGRLGLA